MITKTYYELEGDCEYSDISIKFSENELKKARAKEQEWKKDPGLFNVALWKVTITKEIT